MCSNGNVIYCRCEVVLNLSEDFPLTLPGKTKHVVSESINRSAFQFWPGVGVQLGRFPRFEAVKCQSDLTSHFALTFLRVDRKHIKHVRLWHILCSLYNIFAHSQLSRKLLLLEEP